MGRAQFCWNGGRLNPVGSLHVFVEYLVLRTLTSRPGIWESGGMISSIVSIRVHVCINNAGDDLVFAWVVNVIKGEIASQANEQLLQFFVCIAEKQYQCGAIKGGNQGGVFFLKAFAIPQRELSSAFRVERLSSHACCL
ncbi:hypothetical protein TNCV_1768841 [Trichonephila clavipes]|nr:hypothetical protein TNCV_1768841 [Trichonephila clavipes]